MTRYDSLDPMPRQKEVLSRAGQDLRRQLPSMYANPNVLGVDQDLMRRGAAYLGNHGMPPPELPRQHEQQRTRMQRISRAVSSFAVAHPKPTGEYVTAIMQAFEGEAELKPLVDYSIRALAMTGALTDSESRSIRKGAHLGAYVISKGYDARHKPRHVSYDGAQVAEQLFMGMAQLYGSDVGPANLGALIEATDEVLETQEAYEGAIDDAMAGIPRQRGEEIDPDMVRVGAGLVLLGYAASIETLPAGG